MSMFGDDGWFIAHDVFSADECDALVAHVHDLRGELKIGRKEDGRISYRPMLSVNDETLLAAATDARWAPVILPLLGPDVRLYWEQLVVKPPEAATPVPWHQDNGYGPVDPIEYVTCWLALEDATIENGCLEVLPGSHLDGIAQHSGSDEVQHLLEADAAGREGVKVPVAKGSALVFSSLLLHRSGPNRSDRSRAAWVIQFCDAATVHGETREPFDDRPLVAEAGVWRQVSMTK
jgi:ectoine hydroxylase-related dioxygenase (phytanoyl-CoA dioxygenase family)